jgi:hypothetical protein
MFASEIRTRDRPNSGDRRQETGDRRQETGDRRQETGDAVLWSAQRPWGCLTDWVMERVGRADGGIPIVKRSFKELF